MSEGGERSAGVWLEGVEEYPALRQVPQEDAWHKGRGKCREERCESLPLDRGMEEKLLNSYTYVHTYICVVYIVCERAQSCSCSIEISDTYVYIYIYIYGRTSSYMRMLGGT